MVPLKDSHIAWFFLSALAVVSRGAAFRRRSPAALAYPMIATDRFVFIHLHKSGGTFVNECLLRFIPGAHRLGYHLPRTLIPSAIHTCRFSVCAHTLELLRLTVCVSVHASGAQRPLPNPERGRTPRIRSHHPQYARSSDSRYRPRSTDRGTAVANTRDAGSNVAGLRARVHPRHAWLRFDTWLYRYMFSGGAGTLHVGRMENMRADLLEMLAAVGQPVTEPMRRFILQHEPTHTSSHRPYTEHYSDSLRDLVAERDREIIAGDSACSLAISRLGARREAPHPTRPPPTGPLLASSLRSPAAGPSSRTPSRPAAPPAGASTGARPLPVRETDFVPVVRSFACARCAATSRSSSATPSCSDGIRPISSCTCRARTRYRGSSSSTRTSRRIASAVGSASATARATPAATQDSAARRWDVAPRGRTSRGTPWLSAARTVPAPPWVITTSHRGKSSDCGTSAPRARSPAAGRARPGRAAARP